MSFPYPWFPVQFTKDGTPFLPAESKALLDAIAAGPASLTDVFVMSHGWNNNITDAVELYSGLAGLIKQQIDANSALSPRHYAVCGVLWPSKKFEEKDLIPSGAASLNDAVDADGLKERIQGLQTLLAASDWPSGGGAAPAAIGQLEALMDTIEDNPNDMTKAVSLLRGLLPGDHGTPDDASDQFLSLSTPVLIERLSKQINPPAVVPHGVGAASIDPFSTANVSGLGGAASFRDILGGIKSGFLHALNYATYYVMKARAGDVGVKGVAPLLVQLRNARPDLRLHLIGHSFGCRVLAAAVNALPEEEKFRPDTVMLLEGAFSHNGFALEGDDTDRGAFRDVVEKHKVRGPILISHTRNDKAVGIAYPIASRLSGVNAAELGDADDKFGGLGSNGTQTKDTTPERLMGTLLPAGGVYPFAAGVAPSTPCNLKADDFIKDHSDIVKPEVAFVLTIGMTAPVLPVSVKSATSSAPSN